MLQFALTGLLAVAVVGVAGAKLLREQGRDEAVRDARTLTNILAMTVVEPELSASVAEGNPAALRRFDRAIRTRVLRDPVVRVKLWTSDGRVLYSDATPLVGRRFPLTESERSALDSGTTAAEISDLSKPENRFERGEGPLLELYRGVRAGDGRRMLFEIYVLNAAVSAKASDFWRNIAPALLGGLLLLWLVQLPLARSLARRIRRGQREQEALLHKAVTTQEMERKRIARDLHDGPVQKLAGVSFAISAARTHLASRDPVAASDVLNSAGVSVRTSLRDLRGLFVDLYPPALGDEGLAPALADLLSGMQTAELHTNLQVAALPPISRETELSLYRGAQEALRNAARHANAHTVAVKLGVADGRASLEVIDDGHGFDPTQTTSRSGHLGLQLLDDLARARGGRLELRSRPGEGTCVRLEMPT
jgi:two-component system NarL family sensor kinase